LVTFPDSVLPTPAILTTTHFEPMFSLIAELIMCTLLYLLVFVWRKGIAETAKVETSLG